MKRLYSYFNFFKHRKNLPKEKKTEYTNNLVTINQEFYSPCPAFSNSQIYYNLYHLPLTDTAPPHFTSLEKCIHDCFYPNPTGAKRSLSSMWHRLLLCDCSENGEASSRTLAHQLPSPAIVYLTKRM